jgi:O-antigen ligase
MNSRTTSLFNRNLSGPSSITAIVIEASWLAALILVPLVFRGRELVAIYSQPKYFLVHLAALVIVVAWITEWALDRSDRGSINERVDGADQWVGREPGRWAVLAFGGFALTAIASTLLSPLPGVSIWGRDFEDLGYELYSTLSFLVILFAIAFRMRTREQVLRFALAIAATGTLTALYGIAQHFGWDPIGRGANATRVISSMGNPLFLGSYLVMTGTVTVAVGLFGQSRDLKWALPVVVLALGVQLAALWFAGGRGPWLGTTVGLISFIIMGWLWFERRTLIQAVGVIISGLIVAIIVVALTAGAGHGERGLGDIFRIPGEVADAVGFAISPSGTGSDQNPEPGVAGGASTSSDPADPDVIATIRDERSDALSGRAEIWRNVIDLSTSREVPIDESSLVHGLRFLFGFGPDMFFYSYPTVAEPQTHLSGVSHAHNYLLQILMEEGIVGALFMVAAAVFLIIAAWRVLRARNSEPWLVLIMVGVLAALAGRAVDQAGSVARISDLMLFFALLGALIALTEIARGGQQPVQAKSVRTMSRSERRRPEGTSLRLPALGLIATVTILALLLFVSKDVALLRAGWIAANGFEQKAASDADAAFRSFERAAELGPDVERYALEQARLLRRAADASEDPEVELRLVSAAYDILRNYEQRDPHAWVTQRELAGLSLRLGLLGQDERMPEAAARYTVVAQLMEAYPFIQSEVATAFIKIGDPQSALVYSTRAIGGEASTSGLSDAWWARGSALMELGQPDEAMEAFETAIKRNPRGTYAQWSHLARATILEAAGDDAGAAAERDKAAEIY